MGGSHVRFPKVGGVRTRATRAVAAPMLARLQPYLINSPHYNPLQSAYRSCHSTETVLLTLLNKTRLSADHEESTLLVSLDLSAAFNTIDHAILLDRLRLMYGVDGPALNWLRSYLTQRFQYVKVGQNISSSVLLSAGVSQAVTYLGFHKGGPNFLWSLVLTQRGTKPGFPNFFVCQKNFFFAKGGHGPMAPPPKYATAHRDPYLVRSFSLPSSPLLNLLSPISRLINNSMRMTSSFSSQFQKPTLLTRSTAFRPPCCTSLPGFTIQLSRP